MAKAGIQAVSWPCLEATAPPMGISPQVALMLGSVTSTPTAEGDEVYTRELSWNPFIERNNYSLCCAGYSVRCVLDPD